MLAESSAEQQQERSPLLMVVNNKEPGISVKFQALFLI